MFSFVAHVPEEAKEMRAVAALDQEVLKHLKDQETGSDTVARCTSGSETSCRPVYREFRNQCVLFVDRTANLPARGKGKHQEGLQQAAGTLQIRQENAAFSTTTPVF